MLRRKGDLWLLDSNLEPGNGGRFGQIGLHGLRGLNDQIDTNVAGAKDLHREPGFLVLLIMEQRAEGILLRIGLEDGPAAGLKGRAEFSECVDAPGLGSRGGRHRIKKVRSPVRRAEFRLVY